VNRCPVDKKSGDVVFAGTQNLTGVLEVKVTRAGHDTTLGRVRELILAAEKTKLPIMRFDRSVHGLLHATGAGDCGLVWAFTDGQPGREVEPRDRRYWSWPVRAHSFWRHRPAMVAALSAAARLGILIKNVSDIELAARINALSSTRREHSPPASWP
jgi:Cd2+/Zn2+-exporting ATPase